MCFRPVYIQTYALTWEVQQAGFGEPPGFLLYIQIYRYARVHLYIFFEYIYIYSLTGKVQKAFFVETHIFFLAVEYV